MILLLAPLAFAASAELNPGDDVASYTASLAAGDEILLNTGTYTLTSALEWQGAGTEASPVKITAKGGPVVLELPKGYEVAYLHDASYFEITGITFSQGDEGQTSYGLYAKTVDHITIRDCVFGPTKNTAVYFDGNNSAITFEHNEIAHTTDGNGLYIGCSDASCWTQDSSFQNNWIHDIGGTYNYGLYLANGGQGNILADNVIYNNAYRGLTVHSTEYGDPNLVDGNAIWNVGDAGLLVRGPSVVQNNLIFNVVGKGLYSGDNDRGTLENAAISHNTVFNTTDWGIYIEDWAGRKGMVLANNAVANTTGYGLTVHDGGVDDQNYLSHNVVSGLVQNLTLYAGTDSPVIPGGGALDFTDPTGWNFYPTSGSALVNAGDATSNAYVPATDFNGAPRNGDSPDAGAYERASDENPGWVLQEGFKDVGELNTGTGDVVGGGCCKGGDKGAAEAAGLLPFGLLALGGARRRRVR